MKAAIVLYAGSISLQQQAHEIQSLLDTIETGFCSLEMWLFYQDPKPEVFPKIDSPLSAIKLIRLENVHSPESYLQLLERLMGQYPMDMLVFASDGLGEELASRLGYRLNGSSCLQVEACCLKSGSLEIIKPVYGNNLTARFVLDSFPCCLSVAKQVFCPVKMIPCESVSIEVCELDQTQAFWVKETRTICDEPGTGLADADLVLVVGQGVNNKETMDVLQGIANTMGAELGASRPVVMNAWMDMNRLIGASGLIISPKICIAAGISGTGVFSTGIKNSAFIVAINIDSKAPIFQMADVGIVGDLQAFLLELEKVIKADNEKKGFRYSAGSGIEI
jgi:electron transfer flavoprotein alpha subunit